MCFCNVYAWILIKSQLHFDFLVVFTLLLRPCQLFYHVSWLLYLYWSLYFLFFVLTSGRPLPVTTFFVFLKPLCSHLTAQIVIQEFSNSAVYRCQRAFHWSQNLQLLQPALLQLFCSASWSHSAALQQHCSFRTGIIMAIDCIQQYFIHQLVLIFCSLRSKRFQSSYCTKVRAGAKKKGGRGRGRVPSFPSPSPVLSFFALVPTFSTNSRGNAWYITTWISSW